MVRRSIDGAISSISLKTLSIVTKDKPIAEATPTVRTMEISRMDEDEEWEDDDFEDEEWDEEEEE